MCLFCLQGTKGKQFFYLMEIFFGMQTTEGKVPGVQVAGGGARESGGRLQGDPQALSSWAGAAAGPSRAGRGCCRQGLWAQPGLSPGTVEQGIAGPCSPLPCTWT